MAAGATTDAGGHGEPPQERRRVGTTTELPPESGDEAPAPLDERERRQLALTRRFGTTGALILAVGAIGAGAAPVDNPVSGMRLIGLPARMPTVAMACSWLGVLMIVIAWLWLGKLAAPGRSRMLSRTQLGRTIVMWALPLAVAPPLFSRDMYAYLAQSAVAASGADPYQVGPDTALGVDHPLTANVPNIWRDTPAPYGPGFLMFGRVIAVLVGNNVVFGVLMWRIVMLVALALAIWAIPHLAARCGVHPSCALWLGAANPIVLFHVVSGMHNEALLMGLMLAGIELGLRLRGYLGIVAAAVVIVIAGAVKPPAFIALGFFGIYLARRRGGRIVDLLWAALLLTAVFLVTMTVITVTSTWGLGWLETFDVPNRIKTWLAPMTALGMFGGGGIGMLLGIGNHTDAMLSITKVVGYGLSVAVCLWLLWRSFRGRVEPLTGLGVTLGAVALFGPVLHPWYLLWALPPLAASTNDSRFRNTITAVSAVVALLVPPTGAAYVLRAYMIPFAVIAALLAFALVLLCVRGRVPRLLPPREERLPASS
ncbi:polyprenol phosphomannose-dependent alpha 1,6 mannosyltransferase MptB [Actinopolyspora saharensis]|uniref:Alpha-1,6-mannosyltransferase n=1 Tax=Actinopolyspora saharensis TaxID=995062 RepID=A0A1H0YB62_9ACTN|nr:polyprenol phosphomannose-dependent alpha 1,6 mannosyltransferase MptB [Actinopolyspora saharensis]SDQ12116.1 alpha-1,6-mannosyltransferase [Actinopolyspora saharensis]